MQTDHAVAAIFATHAEAETAIKTLAGKGFDIVNLSLIGRGYHSEEQVIGFYNLGDRVRFWGTRGAFWGGMWGLFFGGLFMTIPVVGHVVVLGYLAATALSAVEGAAVVGGVSAIAAAIGSIGIPHDSVLRYERAIKADDVLVMAHGSRADVERARTVLATINPKQLEVHPRAEADLAVLEAAAV